MKRGIKFVAGLSVLAMTFFSCFESATQEKKSLDELFEEQVRSADSIVALGAEKTVKDSLDKAFSEFKWAFNECFGFDVIPGIKTENSFGQRDLAKIDIFSFLAFDCSDSAAQQIIDTLHLRQKPFTGLKKVDCGECVPAKFQEEVKKFPVFYSKKVKPVSRYFWYDAISKRAFYLEYELRS